MCILWPSRFLVTSWFGTGTISWNLVIEALTIEVWDHNLSISCHNCRLTDVLPPSFCHSNFSNVAWDNCNHKISKHNLQYIIKVCKQEAIKIYELHIWAFDQINEETKRQKYDILFRQIGELEENAFLGWEEHFCKDLKFIQLLGDTLGGHLRFT